MNCCKEDNAAAKKHGHMSHMPVLVLCCALPIGILALLPLLSRLNPAFSGWLGGIAPFICPLLMIPMAVMMFRDSKKEKTISAPQTVRQIGQGQKQNHGASGESGA